MSPNTSAGKDAEPTPPGLSTLLHLIYFENWLRFYFMDMGSPTPIFNLPASALETIEKLGEPYLSMARGLNQAPVDLDTSRQAILSQAGELMPREELAALLAQEDFSQELTNFQAWLQLHAAQLEQRFFTFENWLNLYARWNEVMQDHC